MHREGAGGSREGSTGKGLKVSSALVSVGIKLKDFSTPPSLCPPFFPFVPVSQGPLHAQH